jgi:hypothetical protein
VALVAGDREIPTAEEAEVDDRIVLELFDERRRAAF